MIVAGEDTSMIKTLWHHILSSDPFGNFPDIEVDLAPHRYLLPQTTIPWNLLPLVMPHRTLSIWVVFSHVSSSQLPHSEVQACFDTNLQAIQLGCVLLRSNNYLLYYQGWISSDDVPYDCKSWMRYSPEISSSCDTT